MPAPLLVAELARAHELDLRRAGSQPRLPCGPDGCDGFFSGLVARVRSDLQRVQLGRVDAVPCPC